MYNDLVNINTRPAPFEFYTADELWTNEHTSAQMLEYHLNEQVDLSSRNKQFIDRSVGWVTTHFGVGADTRVADFGCGPGLYANPLADQGARVTGIDFSQRSLRYARDVATQKGLRVDYECENYLSFESDSKFDLIIMIMCDFCALSPAQRRQLLSKFRGLLAEGGAVLLDVYSLRAFEQREEAASYERNQLSGFWSPDDYFGFLNTFKYEADKVVLDKHTIVQPDGTRTVYNWLQHFSPESLDQEIADSGLLVAERFGDVAGSPFDPDATEFAVVARPA